MSVFDLELLGLGLLWMAYFAFHSLLASLKVKHWVAWRWPELVPAYRLLFNVTAVALILPLLWATLRWPGPWLWQWSGIAGLVADALAVAAIVAFLWTLRGYDGDEFLGLRQMRQGRATVEDQETFHISTLHRYVRHPWYFLGLVILWTRDMDTARLMVTALATGYFAVGSMLEERKLLRYHGSAYARYRERVPGLIPRPWRRLNPEEARLLAAASRAGSAGAHDDRQP
jgi:protein-S-isoprenylcysteine O-methyltransferase Ste14